MRPLLAAPMTPSFRQSRNVSDIPVSTTSPDRDNFAGPMTLVPVSIVWKIESHAACVPASLICAALSSSAFFVAMFPWVSASCVFWSRV
jgi:hypothetical protein